MNQTLDTMLESLNLLAIRDVYQEVSTRIIKEQMSPIYPSRMKMLEIGVQSDVLIVV
jgi:hypothetical protein